MMSVAYSNDGSDKRALEDWIAPDCHGENFYDLDPHLDDLLRLYMPDDLREHMTPHFRALGEIAGTRLDKLAAMSDRHEPKLHYRDHYGRDQDWIEFHPAYREMEQIAYGDFGIHCMTHKPGVFGWRDKMPQMAKYIFQYLFVQSEFGLMCPVSATDTSALLIERYGKKDVQDRFLPGMYSQDMTKILKGAQFMTEKTGGSDVGNIELEARLEDDGEWRLYGEKWFCSCADGDVAVLLARPLGASNGSRGLGLFAMPRTLDDGTRNKYRIVRLKPKLGTKSMASGEIIFDGAVAYPLGDVGEGDNLGLKQMLDMVNMSRLSHGVRGAAMMRRCANESLIAARNREAFGELIIKKPLLRRQLMKVIVPTEQAISGCLYTARMLERANAGDKTAEEVLRIMTPLVKFRICRDNVEVAQGAMEIRGGNGFIEDWVNPKLLRDSMTGLLWEGTSNINALDVTTRAIAKVGAQEALQADLNDMIDSCDELPGQFKGELSATAERAFAFAKEVAATNNQPLARQASDALYNTATAFLMATEGAMLGAMGHDARRLILSRMVVDHKLRAKDPLAVNDGGDNGMVAAILSEELVTLEQAQALITG
jgi:alkylation response protein AidB-like acyl-CoA dehydrogenase